MLCVSLYVNLYLEPFSPSNSCLEYYLASEQVVEVVYRYDTKCVPGNMLQNKVAYIQNASIDKTCTIILRVKQKKLYFRIIPSASQISNSIDADSFGKNQYISVLQLQVPRDMKRPIFVYYQLDKFYQNHRRYSYKNKVCTNSIFLVNSDTVSEFRRRTNSFRYATSRSDAQLRDPKEAATNTELCKPESYIGNGSPVVPCGLVAWSLFNDTYSFARRRRRGAGGHTEQLTVIKSGISWRSDRGHLFGDHVFPKNFQNGSLVGGGQLDPTKPVNFSTH